MYFEIVTFLLSAVMVILCIVILHKLNKKHTKPKKSYANYACAYVDTPAAPTKFNCTRQCNENTDYPDACCKASCKYDDKTKTFSNCSNSNNTAAFCRGQDIRCNGGSDCPDVANAV